MSFIITRILGYCHSRRVLIMGIILGLGAGREKERKKDVFSGGLR